MFNISAGFKEMAFVTRFQKRTGSDLLNHCIKKFQKELNEHNFKFDDWRGKAADRIEKLMGMSSVPLPRLLEIEMEIKQRDDSAILGSFHCKNSVTEATDGIDFKVSVMTDDDGKERCVVHMPHHPFPRELTTSIDRMGMLGFLISDANDYTGFTASLAQNGLPPPPAGLDDFLYE